MPNVLISIFLTQFYTIIITSRRGTPAPDGRGSTESCGFRVLRIPRSTSPKGSVHPGESEGTVSESSKKNHGGFPRFFGKSTPS